MEKMLPDLIKAINRLADAVEKLNGIPKIEPIETPLKIQSPQKVLTLEGEDLIREFVKIKLAVFRSNTGDYKDTGVVFRILKDSDKIKMDSFESWFKENGIVFEMNKTFVVFRSVK